MTEKASFFFCVVFLLLLLEVVSFIEVEVEVLRSLPLSFAGKLFARSVQRKGGVNPFHRRIDEIPDDD